MFVLKVIKWVLLIILALAASILTGPYFVLCRRLDRGKADRYCDEMGTLFADRMRADFEREGGA